MQSARIWNWAQTFSAIYCLNIQLIGHTRATKHTCQSHVPILLLTWKMDGFKQKVISSKLFIRSSYENLEIKAEMLISCLIFIFWCQTQMFSVYSKNKGIGLTVPILLEGECMLSNRKICKIINVLIVTFDQPLLINASLMTECINFFKKNLTDPKRLEVSMYIFIYVGCMFLNILFLVLNLVDVALVLRLFGVKHVHSPHNLFFSLSRAVICRRCVSGMWQRGHRWRSYRNINMAWRVWLSPPIVNTSSVWDTSTTWSSMSGPGRWLAIFVQLWKMAFI